MKKDGSYLSKTIAEFLETVSNNLEMLLSNSFLPYLDSTTFGINYTISVLLLCQGALASTTFTWYNLA